MRKRYNPSIHLFPIPIPIQISSPVQSSSVQSSPPRVPYLFSLVLKKAATHTPQHLGFFAGLSPLAWACTFFLWGVILPEEEESVRH
jgi:hypothetical protein